MTTLELMQMRFEGNNRMAPQGSYPPNDSLQRQRVPSRWDNEGGAVPCGPQMAPASVEDRNAVPENGPAELGALHIRVIVLENLVISLLAAASDRQLELAREMALYISPRPGFTHHQLTTHAAAHMMDLVERASRFHSWALPLRRPRRRGKSWKILTPATPPPMKT